MDGHRWAGLPGSIVDHWHQHQHKAGDTSPSRHGRRHCPLSLVCSWSSQMGLVAAPVQSTMTWGPPVVQPRGIAGIAIAWAHELTQAEGP